MQRGQVFKLNPDGSYTLREVDVEGFGVGVVFYSQDDLRYHYNERGFVRLVAYEELPPTVAEYYSSVLDCEFQGTWPDFAQHLMAYVLYEHGAPDRPPSTLRPRRRPRSRSPSHRPPHDAAEHGCQRR